MAPIKTLLIRKRFHFSSKGTAASLAESQDRCYTRIDAAAGEGGDLPFAARAPRRPSFPVGAFAGACSIVDPTEFSCLAVAFNRALVVADEQSRRLSFLNDQPEQHLNPGHFAPTRHIELRPLTCGQLFEVLNMPRIGMFSSPGTHTKLAGPYRQKVKTRMNDQLPDGCVYLGQNQRGKVIHTYNGWAIQAIDTGTDGYVAWLVARNDLGIEAEITTSRDFGTLQALLHHAVSRIDRWWHRHNVGDLSQALEGQT